MVTQTRLSLGFLDPNTRPILTLHTQLQPRCLTVTLVFLRPPSKLRAYSTSAAIVIASVRFSGFSHSSTCWLIEACNPVRNRCSKTVEEVASPGCLNMALSAAAKSSTLSDGSWSRATKALAAPRGSSICPLAFSSAAFSLSISPFVSSSSRHIFQPACPYLPTIGLNISGQRSLVLLQKNWFFKKHIERRYPSTF